MIELEFGKTNERDRAMSDIENAYIEVTGSLQALASACEAAGITVDNIQQIEHRQILAAGFFAGLAQASAVRLEKMSKVMSNSADWTCPEGVALYSRLLPKLKELTEEHLAKHHGRLDAAKAMIRAARDQNKKEREAAEAAAGDKEQAAAA